jgi:hypothetical protein
MGKVPLGQKKIRGRFHLPFQEESDAQHKREVTGDDGEIGKAEVNVHANESAFPDGREEFPLRCRYEPSHCAPLR